MSLAVVTVLSSLCCAALATNLPPELVAAPSADRGQQPASAPPVVLAHDGRGWSLNGRALPNDAWEQTLRAVFETRRVKHLYLQVPETWSYARLIETVAAAMNAGVERAILVDADAVPANGVAVELHAAPGLEDDLRLPVADVLSDDSPANAVVVRITPASDVGARAAAVVQQLSRGAVVRLHGDADRTLAELWPLLRLGRARAIEVFSLAYERPESPGAMARACRAGRMDACSRIGFAYLSGADGVTQDYREATTWLERGCVGGDAMSCGLLADMHERGTGVAPDAKEALRLYTEGCRLGAAEACEWLRQHGHPLPPKKPPTL